MNPFNYQQALQRISTLLAVISLTLAAIAGITGVLLAYYYAPTAGGAYNSLKLITELVAGGAIVRSLHNIAGNGLIVVGLIELVTMFLGRQFRPAWLTAWISGIFLTLTAIGLSWTAIVLGWDQEGFWRFKIEMGTIEAIPFIGPQLREILTGGSMNTLTVEHMYTLHSYLLAGMAVLLAVIHMIAMVYQERQPLQPDDEAALTPGTDVAA